MPPARWEKLTVAVVLVFTLAAAVFVGVARTQLDGLVPLDASQPVTYFVADGGNVGGYLSSDQELARWALEAWERASRGRIRLRSASEEEAVVRVHWVPASGGQYGEMRPIRVNGRRGAMVFIRPDTQGLGPDVASLAARDRLFRDAVVYLTCLHELGHAFGLAHTAVFDDIMYFFGYGGDIGEYFSRYRRRLAGRSDIARVSGISPNDLARLLELYR